ncbi:helix-turn-helix domain-containing protein [Flagellimonas onchidii]|uniref:helix-turn-helix domain-containing protein n=1 Tax=Flagellimonas onchidii TaxID=2562684 RepID=UPI0010A5CF61|nr:helix-turn-helix domain-containing protein [Allomuricauda onchidii]
MSEQELHAILVTVIKSEMKVQGMKQKEVAVQVGVSESTLIRNLKGKSDWSVLTLLRLIELIGAENFIGTFTDYLDKSNTLVEYLPFLKAGGVTCAILVENGKHVLATVAVSKEESTIYHILSKDVITFYEGTLKDLVHEHTKTKKINLTKDLNVYNMHLGMAGAQGGAMPRLTIKRITEIKGTTL